MQPAALIACLVVALAAAASGQSTPTVEQLAAELTSLNVPSTVGANPESLRSMLGNHLRRQIEAANQASSAAWEKIDSREQWEAFRDEKIASLRASLGKLPKRIGPPRCLVTGKIRGAGCEIRNVVFESRPGLVVTANLYVPDPPRASMPGLVLSHSHHNPKEQVELQDMGMTWARAGCCVLVPDHLGHGERRQHPFVTAADHPAAFQVGRQDYYFRYDTSLQLYLAGESLMGWMVHDLMTGIDLLLAEPGIDPQRIAILGSVAGGGDPAAVTAALDERIACACPFNFGGPQPETKYPLPDDAVSSFNYAGGGSWESTRNLFRSAGEGFLPWVIVGSLAPRHLIHAHEFAWDGERDPVWKRYQKIWGLYSVPDRLAVAHGHGTLTGQDPPGSHCNNIGVVHRRQIHAAFRKWFGINVQAADEFSQRRSASELNCLTEEARRQFQPRLLHQILTEQTSKQLATARQSRAQLTPQEQRTQIREQVTRLLAIPKTIQQPSVVAGSLKQERRAGLNIHSELLETESGIHVPVLRLVADFGVEEPASKKLLLAIADDGCAGILKRRSDEIAKRLSEGWTVVFAEVRGTGMSAPSDDQGPLSALTRHSATSLMLGQPLLGGQLRDLLAVSQHLKQTRAGKKFELAVLGESSAREQHLDTPLAHPHRVNARPTEPRSAGALLALLFACIEDEIARVETAGGLQSFQTTLDSPFVRVPHTCIIPGVLAELDVPDLLPSLAPPK